MNLTDIEIEETGGYKEPNNKYFLAPRLFVVSANGSAKELLCEEQLEYAMRAKSVQQDLSISEQQGEIINNQMVDS